MDEEQRCPPDGKENDSINSVGGLVVQCHTQVPAIVHSFDVHTEVVEGRGQLSVVQVELEVVCSYLLRDLIDVFNLER